MHGQDRMMMLLLDAVAIAWALGAFRRAGARLRAVGLAAIGLGGWLALLHVGLAGQSLLPRDLGGLAFLGIVLAAVGLAGALLAWLPVRAAVARLGDEQLLRLQGVRLAFGATFLAQGLTGSLPLGFGVADGLTHMTAGALGLAAAAALRRGARGRGLAWIANLFGLADIAVVLCTIALQLLPEMGPNHPMMYAVFLPAPFWFWWHVLSLRRLVQGPAPVQGPTRRRVVGGAALAALLATSGLTGCKPLVLRTVMGTVDPYFHGPAVDRVGLDRITEHVYSFQWNWTRNLVVVTGQGLMVIDPMGPSAARALKAELDARFPGQRVMRLVYSHYHLDHARGGEALDPVEVVAHERCPSYWASIDHQGVVPPTRLIQGDTDLSFGGVTVHALDMGPSHTDTLYAFHLPGERVLFTADLGLVRAVAPVGVPDRYAPGYRAALDRVAQLDFDLFVPSHFGVGTRQDLVDWRDMMEYGRELARKALARHGGFGERASQMGAYFDAIYYPMRQRYGTWHGFDEMAVLNIVRDLEGEALGH
jgi:glyoxylase-like metal-dependent hydrolase (beta-lactamase superfamily II)